MRFRVFTRRFLRALLSIALLPIIAITSTQSASAAGLPLACDATLYQISNGILYKLNTATDQYAQVGAASSIAGLSGIGLNPADNYIYANANGTTLKQIARDGSSITSGTITGLTNIDGADFLSNDQMLAVSATTSTLQLVTLSRSAGTVNGATATDIALTGSGYLGSGDIAVYPGSGGTSQAVTLAGTTLSVFSLASSAPTTATYSTKTVSGLQNGATGSFESQWMDSLGNFYAWDAIQTPAGTTNALYEISATDINSGATTIAANKIAETTFTGAAISDGANCKTAPAPFAPQMQTTPTAGSITSTAATITAYVTTNAYPVDASNASICYSTTNTVNTTLGFGYGLLSGSTCVPYASALAASGTEQNFNVDLTGLNSSTTYYFQVQATNTPGGLITPFVGYGSIQSFATIAPPAFGTISPAVGSLSGGTSATITGTSLSGSTSVTVGGVAVASFTVNSSTSISITTPAGAAIGPVDVVITTPSGVITGTGVFTYQTTVTFNSNGGTGTLAPQSSGVSTTLSPNTFTLTNSVFLGWNTAADGSGTPYANGVTYNFTADLQLYAQWMTITSIAPITGTAIGGTSVTITGTHFDTATSAAINGVALTSFVVVNSTTITGVSPAGASAGAKNIQVISPAGTAVKLLAFTYTLEPQAITFTSTPSTPTYGGTYPVTATGGGSGNAVTFTSATASVCTMSGSTVTFVGNGTCTINANQAATALYAAATQVQQTFTVATKVLTITALDATKAFGNVDPTFSFSATGLAFSDSVVSVGILRLAGEAVGTYTISASGTIVFGVGSAANYTINRVTGTLTIDPLVTASAGANGSISPSGTFTATYNATQNITITPNTGYHVLDVVVDSVSKGPFTSWSFVNDVANHTISVTFAINTYTLTYSAGSFGSVSGGSSQVVNYNTDGATVTADPDPGYHFTSWSDGNLNPIRTDTAITANLTVTARFAINTFTITATAGSNGSITPAGANIEGYGDTQEFTIAPNSGYYIANVLVDGVSVGAVTSYIFNTVATGHTISATFAINSYTLTYAAGADGSLTGTTTQVINSGSNGTAVTAVANSGYHFVSWSDGVGTATRTDTNVTSSALLTATFAHDTYTINVSAGSNGSVSPSGSVVVNAGDTQTITITPANGYHVLDIKVDGSTVVAVTTYSFTSVAANHTLVATFALNAFTLTYTAGANGTLTGSTSQALGSGANGTAVTANPNTGYHFVSWSDGVLTPTRAETNVTANHTVVANFAVDTFTLTATAGSNGSISPSGISVESYGYTQSVVIVPALGYHVLDVLVDGSTVGNGTTYSFTSIAANHIISATFAADALTLTYTANSNGTISGTTPQGLSYGGSGTAVTAVPATGFHFTAWSDGNINPTRTDTNVKLTQTFTANFISDTLVPITYLVTSSANAGGTITPSGARAWNSGDVVLVTFQANTGYHISDVSVDGSSIGVVTSKSFSGPANGNHTVAVTFASNATTFALTYTANAHGAVTGSTSQNVASGASGTAVTAVPATGFHFTAWSDGNINPTRTDTNVTADISVSANFQPIHANTFNLSYLAGPGGSVTGTTLQVVNQGADGTTVTAVPASGYHFVSWSDGVLTASRTDTNVGTISPSDLSVTANFAQNSYTLTYAVNSNGALGGTLSQVIVPGGSGTAVTATPNSGYTFSSWSDGSTSNPRSDTNVQYSATYTANFELTTQTVGGGGSGPGISISSSTGANGNVVPLGSTSWYAGDIATFAIIPDVGYHTVSVLVDGSSVGTPGSYSFTNISTSHTISATFAINTYTLTYTAGAHGSVTGTSPQSVNYGASGTAVTPVAANGYSFLSWSDGSSANPRTDSGVTSDITVTALFVPNSSTTYNLIYVAGSGGAVSGASSQTVNQGADGGSVTAVPATGYHFVSWSDANASATRTDTNIQANLSFTATFAINVYTLTYVANSNGSITGITPQSVNGGANGTQVTAVANSGFHFTSWSDGNTTAARTENNVQGSITYTANFASDLPAGSTFTVTSSSGANGVVSPVGAKIWNTHDIAGVYIVPNPGYHTVNVVVDGVSRGVQVSWFFADIGADHTVSATFASNSYSLTYSASSNGTVTGNTSQTVSFGADGTTVTPVPSTGYHFVSWSDSSTSNPRTDTNVSADIAVTALFAINTYTITSSAGSNGSISPNGATVVNYGQSQGYTITPATGYHVAGFLVDGSSAGTPTSYTFSNVTADHTISVTFAANTYTLTYSANSNGGVTGSTSQSVGYGASGTAVTPVPATGYHFSSWSDASSANPRTDTNVTSNISVTASFAINTFTVTATAGSNGSITNPGVNAANYGDSQGFTITSNTGYQIASVVVDGSSVGLVSTYNFTNIQANHTIVVTFSPITFTLTYSTNGFGTITGTASQSVGYNGNGTQVTAVPQTGYHFTSWSDGSLSTTRTDLGILANHTYSARFAINVYTITSSTDTNGSISPLGATSENYGYAQTYNMAPHAGYHIVDVQVDSVSVGTVNTYTFPPVSADHTISVSYAINTYTLTYNANAHGTVTGTTPQTVNWGTSGTSVTAVPATGYHFTTWSDGNSNATRTDTNVTSNITVNASFAINTYTIVSSVTSGSGTITPLGSTLENYGFTQGYSITPTTGYHIVSVTVDSVGVGTPSTYTFSSISAAHTIAVVFAINTYTVTYVAGAGGSVTGTLSQGLNYGADATSVTAVPNTGFHFVNWSDANASTSRTDTFITANHTFTANFAINTFTITSSAGSNGTVTPNGVTTKNYNTNQTVTFTPSTGYHVLDVLVDGTSVGAPVSYAFNNITTNHTVSVTYAINAYTLTYLANSNGTISGTTPQGVNYGGSGSAVTAVANTGYHFTTWSDGNLNATRTDTNVNANHTFTATFAVTVLSLTYAAGSNGSVTGTLSQSVNYGNNGSTVTAVPSSGYHFTSWSDGNTIATRIDTNVTSSHAYTASFALNLWLLTYSAGSGGTISGTASQAVATGASGTQVTAVPSSGYFFTSWSDGNTNASRTDVNVTSDRSFTANFQLLVQPVNYAAGSNGSITGSASQSVNYGSNGTSVTATPNTGYHFTSWSDGNTNASRSETNVRAALSFTASFAINTYNIVATAGSNGAISSPGTTVANYGDTVSYTITPASGYHVATVLVDGNSAGTITSYSFTSISAGHAIQVTFALNLWNLTYVAGANGTVSGNTAQAVVPGGNGTTVTAIANTGFYFVNWSDGSTTASRTDLNITADKTFTANFSLLAQPVTYSAGANGSITGNTSQSVNYGSDGTSVTAVPNTGYHFDTWSDGNITATRHEVNVTTALSFTASFAINTYTLSAIAGANGSISSPGSTVVNYGDSKSYTITPNIGYKVASVLVDGTGVGTPLTYSFTSISAGHSIQVTFTPITFTVSASAGAGGSVTPNGSVTVNYGQSAAVTISSASGFHISDVLVDGSSRGVITSITFGNVTADHSVVAAFEANAAATHTVSYVASGSGSITGSSQQLVADGANATTVAAVPDRGAVFDSWSDGSAIPTRTDTNIKSDLVFSARFKLTTFVIIASAGPNGTITPSGSTTVNYGSSLQIAMRPNSGYHVFNVQLDGNSIGAVGNYSFTNITAGHAISVTFAADITTTDPKPRGTPTPTPTPKPTPKPTSSPTPTPTSSPSSAPTSGPIVKEGTNNVKSIVDGNNDPVSESLLPTGNGVQLAGKDWKIQIASDKKSVYGIALPSSLQIFLIRGVNATTSGSGFKPGTIAKVFLYSTGIYLGQALVGPDGKFATTFPVSAGTTLGDHVMQVEGTSYDDKTRTAAVGLKVINKPKAGLVHLGTIYYDVNVSILTPTNIAKLASVFTTIQNNGYKKIWIYGYTDIQTGVDNKVLSRHRSIRIAEMLNAILPQSIVGFKYFGPAKPKDAAHTQAAFAKNRRSEIWGQL